jgi:hypothetical protein
MLTADTITDEEIRALRVGFDPDHKTAIVCNIALGLVGERITGGEYFTQYAARFRCAEILNARTTKEP